MEIKELLKLTILQLIKLEYNFSPKHSGFADWLEEHFDLEKLDDDYIPLLDRFLNEYALNKTEKSE